MGRYLDIGGTRYLLEQLHDIMEKMLVGDVDLSNYVTKTELQKILDELNIDIDLSAYATKEDLENAIKGIDLSAYATTQYVDNALANVPTDEVDLSNYYNKEEVDEKDLMIAPFNCHGDRIVSDNMPDIKAYAGTNTITFETDVDVIGGILVNGKQPYYFNDYAKINGNTATFEAESECNVKDYVFTIGDRPDGLTTLTLIVTNGSHSDTYSIPLHENDIDGSEYVYYRKIWGAPLYIKRTKLNFAQSSFAPINTQVYENRDAIKELQNSGVGTNGKDGEDGFSPIATVTKADGVATISITDANGTTTVTVSDGVNGQDGKDGTNGTNGINGTDGITPHIDETTKHWFIGETDTGVLAEGVNGVDGKDGTNGVDGTNGQDGADGYTPVRGTDYWTEQDIQTIKNYIDTELGVIENGSY